VRKNFRHLFDEKKVFGVYTDELFVAVMVSAVLLLPFYTVAYYSSGFLNRFGGLGFVVALFLLSASIVSLMKFLRGNEDKTFYVKIAGRNEKPKTLKGRLARLVVMLLVIDKIAGRKAVKVKKTRNYSP
jgi:hypothetical protein